MALSDLAVFNEQLRNYMGEILAQQIEVFNGACENVVRLAPNPFQGDYKEESFFDLVTDIVKDRNPGGSGAIAEQDQSQTVDRTVKLALGTYPMRMDKGKFNWTKQNPELAAATYAQQLSVDMMKFMLERCLTSVNAALDNDVALVETDVTAVAAPDDKLTPLNQNNAQSKFGDGFSRIRAWFTHSKPVFDYFGHQLTNAERLFVWDRIVVLRDFMGRPIVATDAAALVNAGPTYNVLGLVQGACQGGTIQNWDTVSERKTGDENLITVVQSEGEWSMSIKGYAYNTVGGRAPNLATLGTSTNWTKVVDTATNGAKNLPGVRLLVN